MKATVFVKENEDNKVVEKNGWNWWGFIFNWAYFLYKGDFIAAVFILVYVLLMIEVVGPTIASLSSVLIGGFLANHRLHRFYLNKGYKPETEEDQAWIDANIKGVTGRG